MGTGLVAALALTCALGQTPTHVVAQGRDTSVGPDQAVGDVLVIDGRLELAGVVRGYLYAVSSTVVLRSSAVLLSAARAARRPPGGGAGRARRRADAGRYHARR
jgi:hypothetical protein